MQLVIIAGGKGTRLLGMTGGLPKPMVAIGGKPLLEHQILLARKHGVEDILILTGFGAESIENYFGDGSGWDVRIRFYREPRPLGTGGALLDAFDELDEQFLVMYGDTMLNVNLRKLIAFHPAEAAASLFLHPNDHPQDSDLVDLNDAGEIKAIYPYPHSTDPHSTERYLPNLVNAALYVFTKKSLEGLRRDWMSDPTSLDICKHLFPKMLAQGLSLRGYRSREYIKDAGTPERLLKVRRHFEMGTIQNGSLETPVPAVFFDRDGTLNYEDGWINSAAKLNLLPGAAEAIRAVNQSGRLAVVITNQPVIARGECSEADMQEIHNRLEGLLGQAHAYIDRIYYCPHHPDAGYPGERAELKIKCDCRKPGTALFETAIRDMNIDIGRSWMVGDSARDIQAAAQLGLSAAFVSCNQQPLNAPNPSNAAIASTNVLDAVTQILTASSKAD